MKRKPLHDSHISLYASEQKLYAIAVASKIRPMFPKTAEHNLMFAIIRDALKDFAYKSNRKHEEVRGYFTGDIFHAEIQNNDGEFLPSNLMEYIKYNLHLYPLPAEKHLQYFFRYQ